MTAKRLGPSVGGIETPALIVDLDARGCFA
jgi:hypothetical protein